MAAAVFCAAAAAGPAKAAKPDPAAGNAPRETAAAAGAIAADTALARIALKPWKGDLQGMVKRHMIRVLVVPNRLYFFTDDFRYEGLSYDLFKAFERDLNRRLGLKRSQHVSVVFVPVDNRELIPDLLSGKGDIAAGDLTITPEREAKVAFSTPFMEDVHEVLVTGPSAAPVKKIEDLAGREIVVRKASSYYDSLQTLNARFRAEGLKPVRITIADEHLEDNDIAEMINASLYPAMVMDLHKAKVWARVFPHIRVHEDIVFRSGGKTGWAFRKGSPELAKAINAFLSTHREGTKFANVLIDRYLKNAHYVKDALAASERRKFEKTIAVFKKYATKYDFDWLLLIAQGYQESGLDQHVESAAGAIGIMQLLPETAAAPPIDIEDVDTVDGNVHAGVKYLRYIVNTYFNDPSITAANQQLLAFAGYNAGPNRISALRKKTKAQGLDPDKWFNNVEYVVGRYVGRQPVEYVRNIYKYYLAYRRISTEEEARDAAKKQVGK